jgi:hypothetical protein
MKMVFGAIERLIAPQRGAPRRENQRASFTDMRDDHVFWKLEALSDRQLLERVGSLLGSSRRLMAELIAQLAEVEERRLHLAAACSSMFAYCLKLGMTEDEAYRRIEVARLARRYPAIFPLLADGRLSISVVALLKHHLSEGNHLDLLTAVSGKSVGQARELIAARFPRPDVPTRVRKLPERRLMLQPSLITATPTESRTRCAEQSARGIAPSASGTEQSASGTEQSASGTEPNTGGSAGSVGGMGTERGASIGDPMSFAAETTSSTVPELPAPPSGLPRATPRLASSRIEPLSAQRYKVQFTAGAELARKLELARDLMRHSHPDGELGPIVERALDLLIESVMKRRFGQSKKPHPERTNARAKHANPEQRGDVTGDRSTMPATAAPDNTTHRTAAPTATTLDSAEPAGTTLGLAEPATRILGTAAPAATTFDSADVQVGGRGELEGASTSSYIPRSTRWTVVERDGLGCSWIDEHGVRCSSQAWLEYDHRHPRAKGGSAAPDNVRLLCRSHNHFAAEREYGRRHVEQAVAERRWARRGPPAR